MQGRISTCELHPQVEKNTLTSLYYEDCRSFVIGYVLCGLVVVALVVV